MAELDSEGSGSQAFHAPSFYPVPSGAFVRQHYVGKQLRDVQAPAVVIDAAVARRNCQLMLDTTSKLGLGFRAHVKSHKTKELSRLQVGEGSTDIKLVASTVAEIEHLQPWLSDSRSQGKTVNVLYGLPVAPSAVPRLAAVARTLGPGSIGLFVDHAHQIKVLDAIEATAWPGKVPVFVKIDIGYHRAGVTAESPQLSDLAYAVASSQRVELLGFYTHMGNSYGVSSPEEALQCLTSEIRGLEEGALSFLKCTGAGISAGADARKITLSLGASPTATAAQNILDGSETAEHYRSVLEGVGRSFAVELHAGVYPLLDMQQLATRARPLQSPVHPDQTLLSFSDLALRVLVEVASVYQDRDKPEALIAAGSIALGREPCKSYPGWGVVAPWPDKSSQVYDPEGTKTGWIVGRISQEHGILIWEGPADDLRPLAIGQKLLVWPNHACISGPSFGYYLVVDSELADPDEIVDVWIRWRGW